MLSRLDPLEMPRLDVLEEEFGEDRLKAVLKANRQRTAGELIQAVTGAVTDFAAGAPAADDLTLVVARRA